MCTAVAIAVSQIPKRIFDEFDLFPRVHDRGGNSPEVWFAVTDPEPLIPVMDGGILKLIRWGSRDRAGKLPTTFWTWRGSVESGAWAGVGCPTEPAISPVGFGCERGIWFKITEGVNALIARPAGEEPTAYMICEPPTRYFKVMTRGERMPWLVNEVI